jgi:hypothetical protein
MSHSSRALVLGLALALPLIARGAPDPRLFNDKKTGIHLYLPEGWILDPSPKEPGMVVSIVGKSPAGGEARMDLSASPLSNEAAEETSGNTASETLEGFVEQLEEQAFRRRENYKRVSKEGMAIGPGGALDAISIVITYTEAGMDAREHWICFYHRHRVYSFRSTCYTRPTDGPTAKKHGCSRLDDMFVLFAGSVDLTPVATR